MISTIRPKNTAAASVSHIVSLMHAQQTASTYFTYKKFARSIEGIALERIA